MPFVEQEPRTFNRINALNLKEDQYGVYGLYRADAWVYVGKGDIRQRLLDHLAGDNFCIQRQKPTHWVDEVTENADAREKELIAELDPICNRRVG